MSKNIKTGLLGIGLETYWGQFEGLLEKLLSIQSVISDKFTKLGSEVIDAGMVDSPSKAIAAAELFNRQGIDLLVLNISTYALSHNILPLLQRSSAPILVLNLQPVKSLDFDRFNSIGDRGKMTGEWLSLCQSCVTPELAGVFNRTGIRYHLITGYLDEDYVWKEIGEWIEACRVKLVLRNNRVGVIGHYYNGMLDVYSDITMLASVFGSHFELMEFGGLKKSFDNATKTEIQNKIGEFRSWFEVSPECSGDDLIDAARGSVALDRLVATNSLNSIAFYFEGEGDIDYEKVVTTLIPGMTLLTGRNIPVAGECEIKNVLA
jgi:L-arabinose isomerase